MTKSEARRIAREVLEHTSANKDATNKHLGKIFKRLWHYGGLHAYFEDHPRSRSTWYKYKAAYQYGVANTIQMSLREADKLEKIDAEMAKGFRQEALRLAVELQELAPDYHKRHRLLAGHGNEKPRPYKKSKVQGKRNSLRGLPHNWQHQIIQNLPHKHQLPALVMALTGCRPVELSKGVLIEALNEGIVFTVQGGKFKEGYQGQEKRVITLQPDKAPALYEHALTGHFVVSINNVETFRKAYRRTAQKLGFKRVSPYCLRHQFSANIKAELGEKWTREDLAKALGHFTDRCQQNYGHPLQSRGGSGLLSVEATSEIKSNRGTIPDMDDSPGLMPR
ncbi:MAG: integrase [Desulfovermiculus sp.]